MVHGVEFNPDLIQGISVPDLTTSIAIWAVLPPILRFAITTAVAKAKNRDLTIVKKRSLVPVIPGAGYYALGKQLSADIGDSDDIITNFLFRSAIAKLTSILPQGGWGTELEGKMLTTTRSTYRLGKKTLSDLTQSLYSSIPT